MVVSHIDAKRCYKNYMLKQYFLTNLSNLMGDMSQQALADQTGISRGRIANWKSRKVIAEPEDIEALAKYFQIEPYYFFMAPGTQGDAKPIERQDDFKTLLDDIANRVLKGQDIITYKQSGASEFVRILRTNYETEHLLPVSWFLEINKELNKYTSVDLIEKIKSIYAERDAKKGQSS